MKFPASVSEVYRPLWQEVQNVHFMWALYRQLFGTSPERTMLLNRFAGTAFGTFQRALVHEVVLSIFRLMDPATQRGGREENLSLERLANVVRFENAHLGDRLIALRDELRELMAPHEDLRNKVLAHNDLATTPTLYDGTSTVLGPSRDPIESVLGRMRTFMNTVQSEFADGTTQYYDATIREPGDGEH
jgi:AbiU2